MNKMEFKPTNVNFEHFSSTGYKSFSRREAGLIKKREALFEAATQKLFKQGENNSPTFTLHDINEVKKELQKYPENDNYDREYASECLDKLADILHQNKDIGEHWSNLGEEILINNYIEWSIQQLAQIKEIQTPEVSSDEYETLTSEQVHEQGTSDHRHLAEETDEKLKNIPKGHDILTLLQIAVKGSRDTIRTTGKGDTKELHKQIINNANEILVNSIHNPRQSKDKILASRKEEENRPIIDSSSTALENLRQSLKKVSNRGLTLAIKEIDKYLEEKK